MSLLFYTWLIFCGMSLLAFEDCRGFFMRQSSAPRKCITRRNDLIYNDPSHALPYWVILKDDCLDDKAQFRYNDTEILWHIESGGALNSVTSSTYRNLFSIYVAISPGAKKSQIKSLQNFKQTDAASLYFYNDGICGEPYRDYVYRRTYCDRSSQKFTFGSVTQFGNKMKDVHCSPKQRMVIHKTYYGNFNNSGTFDSRAHSDAQCTAVTSCRLKSLCGGKRSCELTVDNNLLLPSLCSNARKELYTEYTCVDNYINPIAAPEIRLSDGNQGYLEVLETSSWKNVSDENLDENSERRICQHLGFQDSLDNRVEFGNARNGESIVAGDLVCYNTQSGGTSCCVYLQPKTATSADKIPYVECKICDSQLLRDNISLRDTIFDGNGGNSFHEARFTKDGWCSSTPGSYLTIDLQKEYHITRVVVMGGNHQKKWSGSYSLKYSHDESLVDSSSEIQIKGNLNSFQPSTTKLNIYNVRYIKIQSTGNTDFCLRIELCGEVQSLGPVQNIVAKPSNFSVDLSWTIPSPEASTYITHFVIYLNGTEINRISRAYYGNQNTLRDLKPYTNYVVGIKTQHGVLINTQPIVYQNFKTTEAVPSGPPRNVTIESRSENSLQISWKAPGKMFWNGELTGYKICYSTKKKDRRPKCLKMKSLSDLLYTIPNLQPLTKYFVTVSAGTRVGYGNKSLEINEMTDAEPVSFVVMSHLDLKLPISKPASNIREVMVIVKKAANSLTSTKNIETNKLGPYRENTQDPYVTGYLKAEDLPLLFVIGDGKEYNSKTEKYVNQPLRTNSSYIVFLRYFENKDSYYSTDWSSSFKTMGKTADGLKSKKSQNSTEDETRVELLIPLVILALCFLILLGVVVYQRRLIQNNNKKANQGHETSKQTTQMTDFDLGPETRKGANYGQERDTPINDERVYETTDDVIDEIERNDGVRGTEKGQESSDYMSLNDKKEPANVYQALQPSTSDDVRCHIKGDDQLMECQTPSF